jgi:serine/threonine protein kinase
LTVGEGNHLRDRLVAAVGDHYLIEAELGRGGMAVVYRALDVRLNRRVAIKILPPELAFNPSVRSRFLREAQMAAQLTHPNIVPIFAVDERDTDGLVYFVMAFVDGESLAARLRREGAMRIEDVRVIVSQVADALDYAHRQGVVHRDIKPDNILVDRMTGRPLVTDFGIARAAAEESRLTVTGVAVGTPAYMSPEQAMGEREVDGRSDLYSLGIVAYQMISFRSHLHRCGANGPTCPRAWCRPSNGRSQNGRMIAGAPAPTCATRCSIARRPAPIHPHHPCSPRSRHCARRPRRYPSRACRSRKCSRLRRATCPVTNARNTSANSATR